MKKSESEKNRITNITELMTYDREHRITVISVRLKASVSMSMPAGEGCHYIAMKESGLSAPERYTALLHETGHCEICLPIIWIGMYIYRIIWVVIIGTFIKILQCFYIPGEHSGTAAVLFQALWLIITFPFVLVYEIIAGLFITFVSSIQFCVEIDK